jgi:hypothetical protein
MRREAPGDAMARARGDAARMRAAIMSPESDREDRLDRLIALP